MIRSASMAEDAVSARRLGTMLQTTYCKRHPSAESNVACGRCGDPICPRCMVHAPVGVRCPDCGRSRPTPTFDVTPAFLARGIGAGVAVALVCGIAFAVVTYYAYGNLPYNFSRFVAPLLVATLGYLIGTSVSVATNRKRGTKLKLVSGLSMLLGFSIMVFVTGAATLNLFGMVAAAVAFYVAINRF